MVRFKNRWLLVEFIPCTNGGAHEQAKTLLTSKGVWNALKDSVIVNFGDVGWGSVGNSLTVKYFSPTTNMCIVRVGRDEHRIAWGAMTLVQSIDEQRVIPNVIHLSGTIKHAQLAAIAHNTEVIARLKARAKVPELYQHSYDQYLETSNKEIEALQD